MEILGIRQKSKKGKKGMKKWLVILMIAVIGMAVANLKAYGVI